MSQVTNVPNIVDDMSQQYDAKSLSNSYISYAIDLICFTKSASISANV